MATDTLKAGIAALALDSGMSIVFEAIDPTTGLPVTGVIVSAVAIYADNLADLGGGADKVPLQAGLLPG